MTVLDLPQIPDAALAREARPRPGQVVSDAITMTWRNLVKLSRNPELIVFATVQPVIFVLMFVYVFGGAIDTGNVPYVDFLMAGVWVQTVTFGALNTGVGLAEDLQTGLIERFRSLPMARSAVLVGRTQHMSGAEEVVEHQLGRPGAVEPDTARLAGRQKHILRPCLPEEVIHLRGNRQIRLVFHSDKVAIAGGAQVIEQSCAEKGAGAGDVDTCRSVHDAASRHPSSRKATGGRCCRARSLSR